MKDNKTQVYDELSKISDEHKTTPISVGAGLETKPLATLEHEMLTGLEPVKGDLWTNCDTDNVYAWNGDKWVDTEPATLEDKAPTLELYHTAPTSFVTFQPNNNFIITGDNGEEFVCINMKTGKTTLGPEYNPDLAARVFWNCIEQQFKQPDAWEESANITATEVLRDVKKVLGVEEGENVVEVARQIAGDAGHESHCNWHKWDHRFSWSGTDCTCGDNNAIIDCPYIPEIVLEKFSIDDEEKSTWRALSKAEQTFDDAMKVID